MEAKIVAFLYRMPSGIPGSYNRAEHLTVEAGLPLVGSLPAGFGLPLAIDPPTGRFRAVIGTDTAATIVGMLVRPYPSGSFGTASDGLGFITNFGTYAGVINVMRRGYMHVVINGAAAAAKGGTVYIRVAAPVAGKPVGGIEAAADAVPANTMAMPNTWFFMGPADSQGNSEIGINI